MSVTIVSRSGPVTSGSSILKGNGSGGFSNAASGTDYAPATSGTSILKGNGSGGFSSASSGTDYAPATSGSGVLKGNGSGGTTAATAGTDYVAPGTKTTFTKQQNFGTATLTSSSAHIAWDLDSNQVATHTATENTTLDNPTNMVNGGTYIFIWKQHASSPKTLAFGNAYKWPSGSAPTVTATNGATDILTFVSDGTNMYGVAQLAFS